MKSSNKPWLDWENSLELAEEARTKRARNSKRKRKRDPLSAYILLFLCGYIGLHRFYLYDSKAGWRLFCAFFLASWAYNSTKSMMSDLQIKFLIITFITFFILILFCDASYLKRRLKEINLEVDGYE